MHTVERQRDNEHFVELYSRHQRQLGSYLFSLVHSIEDADDLLQQTSLVLWRKFDDFQPGTDFVRWACHIAHLEAMNFIRRKRRERDFFADGVLQKLAETRQTLFEVFDERREALARCLEKLSPADRQIVALCYGGRGNIKQAAAAVERPVDSVYQSLRRIRGALHDCIQRTVAREEKS